MSIGGPLRGATAVPQAVLLLHHLCSGVLRHAEQGRTGSRENNGPVGDEYGPTDVECTMRSRNGRDSLTGRDICPRRHYPSRTWQCRPDIVPNGIAMKGAPDSQTTKKPKIQLEQKDEFKRSSKIELYKDEYKRQIPMTAEPLMQKVHKTPWVQHT